MRTRVLKTEAFVDDFTSEKIYLDRPIIRMNDLPRRCIVVSCVTDTVPLTALYKLLKIGQEEVIDYFTLSRLAPALFEPVDFCVGNREDILANAVRYEWVYSLLADAESKEAFRKVVQFRYTFDVDFMRGFQLRIDEQYFENFVSIGENEVFVDGGGYEWANHFGVCLTG